MQCEMTFKGVDRTICPTCPDLELAIDKSILYADTYIGTQNKIYCTNYDKCVRLYRLIKEHASDETNEKETEKNG